MAKVEIVPSTLLVLEHEGYQLDSVPETGKRVMIRRNGNLSTDVTDLVHPDVARQVALAACVLGLDVAGVDVIAEDISRPLEEQGGVVIEVNAGPGLQMHVRRRGRATAGWRSHRRNAVSHRRRRTDSDRRSPASPIPRRSPSGSPRC